MFTAPLRRSSAPRAESTAYVASAIAPPYTTAVAPRPPSHGRSQFGSEASQQQDANAVYYAPQRHVPLYPEELPPTRQYGLSTTSVPQQGYPSAAAPLAPIPADIAALTAQNTVAAINAALENERRLVANRQATEDLYVTVERLQRQMDDAAANGVGGVGGGTPPPSENEVFGAPPLSQSRRNDGGQGRNAAHPSTAHAHAARHFPATSASPDPHRSGTLPPPSGSRTAGLPSYYAPTQQQQPPTAFRSAQYGDLSAEGPRGRGVYQQQQDPEADYAVAPSHQQYQQQRAAYPQQLENDSDRNVANDPEVQRMASRLEELERRLEERAQKIYASPTRRHADDLPAAPPPSQPQTQQRPAPLAFPKSPNTATSDASANNSTFPQDTVTSSPVSSPMSMLRKSRARLRISILHIVETEADERNKIEDAEAAVAISTLGEHARFLRATLEEEHRLSELRLQLLAEQVARHTADRERGEALRQQNISQLTAEKEYHLQQSVDHQINRPLAEMPTSFTSQMRGEYQGGLSPYVAPSERQQRYTVGATPLSSQRPLEQDGGGQYYQQQSNHNTSSSSSYANQRFQTVDDEFRRRISVSSPSRSNRSGAGDSSRRGDPPSQQQQQSLARITLTAPTPSLEQQQTSTRGGMGGGPAGYSQQQQPLNATTTNARATPVPPIWTPSERVAASDAENSRLVTMQQNQQPSFAQQNTSSASSMTAANRNVRFVMTPEQELAARQTEEQIAMHLQAESKRRYKKELMNKLLGSSPAVNGDSVSPYQGEQL